MKHLGVWSVGTQLMVPILLICSILVPSPTHAYIYAHYVNMTSMLFEDLPALFGAPLPKDGLKGILVVSRPFNGCAPIDPPPPLPPSYDANTTKLIVLIRRYDCNFDIKVLHAQRAGFDAAIVHNMYSDTLLNMNYSNDTIAEEIEIPSVFTSFYASEVLKKFIIPEPGAYIIRCVRYRKRLRKNRLSKEQLKRIPTHRFSKGDDYDLCAICLDEYEEGDKLRVLPCSHAYHCKCVDPWLTQTKKTCPVCKQRVTRNNPEHSESESEEDAGGRGEEEGAEGEADSERTPLLRPTNPGSPSGSPGAYSATTTTTTAQCLASPAHCDSPILGYEGYYSPQEDTDSESDESGEDRHHMDNDTAQLIGRDRVDV
ncbi:hypothetical protein INR49_015610 [Caranx melampygus]|nr:hypothetical protein INR49_015610 [Caranx melampygus]